MANRFSQISTSMYSPLSLDEIMTIPLAKQRQHDAVQAGADELGMLKSNKLAGDSGVVNSELDRLRSGSDEISQILSERGVSSDVLGKFKSLKRDKDSSFGSEGKVGIAQANYDAAMDYRNKLSTDKDRQGGWGADWAGKFANDQISGFKSFNDDGSSNSFVGRELSQKFENEDELIDNAIARVSEQVDPKTIDLVRVAGISGLERAHREREISTKDYNRIMSSILSSAGTNIDLQKSLLQEAEFTGEKTPLDFGRFDRSGRAVFNEDGTPSLDNDGNQVIDKTPVFIPGKSRFGIKASGFGAASSYKNIKDVIKISKDPVAVALMEQGGSIGDSMDMVNLGEGQYVQENVQSIEKTKETLANGEEVVIQFKDQLEQYKEILRQNEVPQSEWKNDRELVRLQDQYITANRNVTNAQKNIQDVEDQAFSRLSEGDQKIIGVSDIVDKYNNPKDKFGNTDWESILKDEYSEDLTNIPKTSKYSLLNEDETPNLKRKLSSFAGKKSNAETQKVAFARIMEINKINQGSNEAWYVNNAIPWDNWRDGSNSNREDLINSDIQARPRARAFTIFTGLDAGTYSTKLGAKNKSLSESFNPSSASIANKGGSLKDNDKYIDIIEDAEEIEYRYELADGIDDFGNSFSNVTVTSDKGSASFQVSDSYNDGFKLQLANSLSKSTDNKKRETGKILTANINHGREIKVSNFGNQDRGEVFLKDNGINRKVYYEKNSTGAYWDVWMQSTVGGEIIKTPLGDTGQIYNQSELALAMEDASNGIRQYKNDKESAKNNTSTGETGLWNNTVTPPTSTTVPDSTGTVPDSTATTEVAEATTAPEVTTAEPVELKGKVDAEPAEPVEPVEPVVADVPDDVPDVTGMNTIPPPNEVLPNPAIVNSYLTETMKERIELGREGLDNLNNDKGREEILRSISDDPVLTDDEKDSVLERYKEIDNLHQSYKSRDSDTPEYSKASEEILLSDMSIDEMKVELDKLVDDEKINEALQAEYENPSGTASIPSTNEVAPNPAVEEGMNSIFALPPPNELDPTLDPNSNTETIEVSNSMSPKTLSKELASEDRIAIDGVIGKIMQNDPEAASNPLIYANKYLGLDEKNLDHQKAIKGFMDNAYPGWVGENKSNVTLNKNAWCAAFVNAILTQSGYDTLDYKGNRANLVRAKEYIRLGEPIDDGKYKPGDIVVTQSKKTGQYHVGFYTGESNGKMLMLGGNQSNVVSVKEVNEDDNRIVSVKRIKGVEDIKESNLASINSNIVFARKNQSTQ